MTYARAEDDLKTLLDNSSWTVLSQGVTKTTYIWAKSHSIALNLDSTFLWNTTAHNVIFIIHPASNALLGRSAGSELFSFTGEMKVQGSSADDINAALTALKTIDDANQYWHFNDQGINGNPKTNRFWSNIIYNYTKYLSH